MRNQLIRELTIIDKCPNSIASARIEARPHGNTDGTKTLSPLRYPGAKRQLIPLIKSLLSNSCSSPKILVEPFAGGASVGIQLLADGVVDRLILNDIDELIYSFWYVAAFDSQWLIEAMWNLEISLARWEHMKTWCPSTARDKALKCLFLNRTSFSGILNSKAGPLGGKKQGSKYPIDCRFSKPTIQHRLRRIAALGSSGAIESVWNCDWKDCIEISKKAERMQTRMMFTYLDPPFYAKSASLYRHSFCHEQHIQLANYLENLDSSWILSYDDHPEVRRLYHSTNFPAQEVRQFSAAYRAGSRSRKATELIVTNLHARF